MEYETAVLQGAERMNGPEPLCFPELLLQANLPLIFTAGLAIFFFFALVSRVARHIIGKIRLNRQDRPEARNLLVMHKMHSNTGFEPAELAALKKLRFHTRNPGGADTDRLFRMIEGCAKEMNPGYRVIAYPRVGEVLEPRFGAGSGPEIEATASSISSKRLDYAVLDQLGRLICAIDLTDPSRPRDAMKSEALRLARVPLIEIGRSSSRSEISGAFANILEPGETPSQHGHAAVHM